jgi:hypothetical protein
LEVLERAGTCNTTDGLFHEDKGSVNLHDLAMPLIFEDEDAEEIEFQRLQAEKRC